MPRRPAMLASSVRAIVAPLLRECPRECGVTNITRVDVSADLSYVTIYVTALNESATAMAYLEGRKKEFQKRLGSLQTHKTPQLRFRIDKTSEEGTRIDQLLERAANNAPEDSSKTSQ